MTSRPFNVVARIAIDQYCGADSCFGNRIQFFIDQFGDLDVTAITTETVELAMDELVRRGKTKVMRTRDGVKIVPTGKPLSPASRNRYLSSLGTLFRDMRRLRLTPRGFVSPTRGAEREPGDNSRRVDVTLADVHRLIAACRLSRNRKLAAIVSMACTTGWRLGSLQSLTWGQLNLENGYADVARTKNGLPHRTILLPWVVNELHRIRPDAVSPHEPVFGKSQFIKTWRRAIKLADLPQHWTFHHCRHIAASILAQSGASIPAIMGLLNSKTPSMALRYTHLNTQSLKEGLTRAWGPQAA